MGFKSKELGIKWLYEERKVEDLIPWEHNPRTCLDTLYHKLVKSLEDNGDFGVFIVNHEGKLIGGHQRQQALREFKVDKVLVKYPERPLTDLEFQRVNLADNKLFGEFDFDMLSAVFDMDVLLEYFEAEELGIDLDTDAIDIKDPDEDLEKPVQIIVTLPNEDSHSFEKQIEKILKKFPRAEKKRKE